MRFLLTPALSAISSTRAPSYPLPANSSMAAARIAERVPLELFRGVGRVDVLSLAIVLIFRGPGAYGQHSLSTDDWLAFARLPSRRLQIADTRRAASNVPHQCLREARGRTAIVTRSPAHR